jgi:nitrogen fixation protein NifZ
MKIEDLELGDVVYAAKTIIDDGSMPYGIEGEYWPKQEHAASSP